MDKLHGIADNLDQLALLSRRGIDVGDLLVALAKIVRGTHAPGPDGLTSIEAPQPGQYR